MTISTDNFEILSNGNVIVSKGETVSFDFEGNNLHFKLSFKTDTENTDGRLDLRPNNDGNGFLDIIFYNLEKPMFASPSQKLKVAKDTAGKQWYAQFSIQSISDGKAYIIFYTWFKDR